MNCKPYFKNLRQLKVECFKIGLDWRIVKDKLVKYKEVKLKAKKEARLIKLEKLCSR